MKRKQQIPPRHTKESFYGRFEKAVVRKWVWVKGNHPTKVLEKKKQEDDEEDFDYRIRGSKSKLRKDTEKSREISRKIKKNVSCCEECSSIKNLQVHHVDKNPLNNNVVNLKKLCLLCHYRYHKFDRVGSLMKSYLIKRGYTEEEVG